LTAFELVRTLPRVDTRAFVSLLEEEVADRLAIQPGGYARGRASAWLAWEPGFTDPPRAIERPRGELWERLSQLVPGIDAAECWLNGQFSSSGIHPHRDASYADNSAWVLNLGPTVFRIWIPRDIRPDAVLLKKRVNAKFIEYEARLAGGELLTFNCKLLHGSRTCAAERWGIGMWRFKCAWKREAMFHRVI
jgi:hypothetical protein